MEVDLKDLRCFVAVAEEGHITRGAERLGMDQPPVSVRIKALERKLGVQLFVRRPRGVELTEAGSALFGEAQALLARLERAVHVTQRAARGEQGQLRIGIAPTAPFHPFVPQCIRGFRSAYPGIKLAIGEGLSDEVRSQLLDDRIDVAFVRVSRMGDERLAVTPILEEPLIAALPRHHPLARPRGGVIASLAVLRGDPFVLYGPPGTGIYDATVEACAAEGFMPFVAQLAPRITSTLGFVGAGMGVALVPASMRRVLVDGVVYKDFGPATKAKAALCVASRHRDRSVVVRNFIAHVAQRVDEARAR